MDCDCITGYETRCANLRWTQPLSTPLHVFKSICLMQIRALTHSFLWFRMLCGSKLNALLSLEACLCSENYLAQSCKQVGFGQLAYTVNEWVAFCYSSNYHRGALGTSQWIILATNPTSASCIKDGAGKSLKWIYHWASRLNLCSSSVRSPQCVSY